MPKDQVLLYGANGYTGELIARYAKEYHITPVLAGRNETLIRALAERLELPYRIFSLDDATALQSQLGDIMLVIHAAGPFANTCKQMVEACIATQTHYIDINGDISVFERIKQYDIAAKQANVMLMPGAGFDVIPTDCTALHLKEQLPDATHLQLAFLPKGGQISHGTATTMASRLGEGGTARENGKLVRRPLGHKRLWVEIKGKKLFAMTIPWGDISTAYHTTAIPNIEVYTGMNPTVYRFLKLQGLFNWILRRKTVRNYIQRKINSRPAGPTDEQRAASKTTVWGKVWNSKGEEKTSELECADGYSVTAWGCLLITQKIKKGEWKPGYQTPASCYGKDLILEIPHSKRYY